MNSMKRQKDMTSEDDATEEEERAIALSVVDVPGGESKVQCCTEQYCIGTWNVSSMNQGKLDLVKQEMARVNILGLSELKWAGMGEFNL